MKNKERACSTIAAAAIAVAAIVSCTNNKGPQAVIPDVSFSKDILPILVADCAINGTCHSGASNSGDNVDFDSSVAYSSIVNKHLIYYSQLNASVLYTEISTGTMPKSPYSITTSQSNLILDWVEQGAKDN